MSDPVNSANFIEQAQQAMVRRDNAQRAAMLQQSQSVMAMIAQAEQNHLDMPNQLGARIATSSPAGFQGAMLPQQQHPPMMGTIPILGTNLEGQLRTSIPQNPIHLIGGIVEQVILPGTIPPIGGHVPVWSVTGEIDAGPAIFASVQRPPVDRKKEPWPCGPDLTIPEWNHIENDIANFMALEASKLDGAGPAASEKACTFIKRALGRNPEEGTTALRQIRAGLPANSALGSRIDAFIDCGVALADMKPLTEALNPDFATWGAQDVSQDPCGMAEGKLRFDIGANPGAWAAKLGAIAAGITPHNQLAQRLVNQLQGLAAAIKAGNLPSGLGALSGADIRTGASFALQDLYTKLLYGEVCDCPEPGGFDPA